MPASSSGFPRAAVAALFAFATLLSHGEQVSAPVAPTVIEALGNGAVPLDGPWEFHVGDDPAWASPALDDSAWTRLSADRPWGELGYARYTGFAWYRCHLALTPAPGLPPNFSLLLPRVDDAYEIYWNGRLVGQNGKLPPHPVWYFSQSAQIIPLGQVQRGILAVRVWKAPLLSDDSGLGGGFEAAPQVGSPAAIATAKAALDDQWLRSRLFLFGENLLYALVALLSFLVWLRNRSQWLPFWMTAFALAPPAMLLLLGAHIHWPYAFAMGLAQPLSCIPYISLWFLLLWLLLLHENRTLSRLTRILASISLANNTLDGVLVAISWNLRWIGPVQTADAGLAILDTVLEAFPLVLVAFAFSRRRRLDSARWLVAALAFLDEMIAIVRQTAKQGRQFTHWSFAVKIDSPLFTLGGSAISLSTLVGVLLLVSIVYAVYHSLREDEHRKIALEREKAELLRAREQMRHYAEHDGLTGLWNHRIIIERLRGEIDRARREGTPLSVVLADIDHFKRINDTFGHPAGDLVLKEISATFMRSVRNYDWVGRYGGEEFLLILPGSGFDDACQRAEELRLAVQSARILDGETTLHVTSSFGVASGFPSGYEAEDVIQIVDAALYRAKGNGRNCVIAADIDVPASEG